MMEINLLTFCFFIKESLGSWKDVDTELGHSILYHVVKRVEEMGVCVKRNDLMLLPDGTFHSPSMQQSVGYDKLDVPVGVQITMESTKWHLDEFPVQGLTFDNIMLLVYDVVNEFQIKAQK